ncbi:MIZ zinc finger family protein [Trichomonas vaginalis G3]|uniref:MIZ zinc finger family protein n=1 Tax=Trichomonas vaginalis (strain ATCC PRA-98 / G3) TaxID=412133 RepID=A2FDM4_TRIV3|nr:SUMO transferase protein [Trichomonas vaginalis G3]EAX97005.1 MIZ zinc finger family protein [Trichomonas vaginalis G3]KAI5487324.1 SUMO transferase protein [Trichomonas vaginalis G3]|eukprot:XP_001309935.1 MIZ zinc finger family protein [Trichomonas vaginalis G3]
MDFSLKRRSNSVDQQQEKDEGKAFLMPKSSLPPKANKYFFIDKEPLTHQQLLAQISKLSNVRIFRVAVCLNLRPANIETLKFFISRISLTDEMMLDKVEKALSMATTKVTPGVQGPINPSSTDYPFFDIRYKPFENGPAITDKPIDMGLAPVTFSFQIPILPPDIRIILQSFLVGVSPPMVRWPQTLSIFVNNCLIKPQGIFNCMLIDLSQFPPGSIVTITSAQETAQYKFIVRCAKYYTYNVIIQSIKAFPNNEYFNEAELSLICPLTGQPLKFPGKGNHCRHTQAFNLKAYLKRGVSTGKWYCPICGNYSPLEALIYSFKTEEALNLVKMSRPKPQNYSGSPQVMPPSEPPQQNIMSQVSQTQPGTPEPEPPKNENPFDFELNDSIFDDEEKEFYDFY